MRLAASDRLAEVDQRRTSPPIHLIVICYVHLRHNYICARTCTLKSMHLPTKKGGKAKAEDKPEMAHRL